MRKYKLGLMELNLCTMQGNLFRRAWEEGYKMETFVPMFMNSEQAAMLDLPYHRLQWSGEGYVLEEFTCESGLRHGRARRTSPDCVFWMGYLYRYWHYLTRETSAQIYATADFDLMRATYAGYHTLSCEMAIEMLKEDAHAA